jgi:hypothetical protein
MARMNRSYGALCITALVVACGPSYESTGVKTPDEMIEEQERLAVEDQKRADDYDNMVEAEETDTEQKAKWDATQAELELKRAARSAETCPDTLPEEDKKNSPKGVATVTLLFNNEGHVKEATVGSPFTDTPVGKCVLRAMGAVIVPDYVGPEKTVTWDVDLTGKGQSGPSGATSE